MLHQPGREDEAGCILLGDLVKHFNGKHIRIVEGFCDGREELVWGKFCVPNCEINRTESNFLFSTNSIAYATRYWFLQILAWSRHKVRCHTHLSMYIRTKWSKKVSVWSVDLGPAAHSSQSVPFVGWMVDNFKDITNQLHVVGFRGLQLGLLCALGRQLCNEPWPPLAHELTLLWNVHSVSVGLQSVRLGQFLLGTPCICQNRLQGANAYIWAVLFEPRMKCADRNLPHSFFFKCAVEFVQHTVIALVLILWIISVGGSQEGELRIEVVCCTMTALLASIWGRIAIHELKKHLENSFTFCMVRSFPSIAMLFWPIAAGNSSSFRLWTPPCWHWLYHITVARHLFSWFSQTGGSSAVVLPSEGDASRWVPTLKALQMQSLWYK